MIIDLSGVDTTQKKYIKDDGFFTLKCIDVKTAGKTPNGNQIVKFYFKNKNDELFIDDWVSTPDSKLKIKEMADAFGFTYDRVNIMHFIGMYLVGHLVKKHVKNKHGETVEVLKCKQFSKSAKLENTIPPENTPAVIKEEAKGISETEIDIDGEEVPF